MPASRGTVLNVNDEASRTLPTKTGFFAIGCFHGFGCMGSPWMQPKFGPV